MLGTFVSPFNPEIESIMLVFLMAIGTDYSVPSLARYREELVRAPHQGRGDHGAVGLREHHD